MIKASGGLQDLSQGIYAKEKAEPFRHSVHAWISAGRGGVVEGAMTDQSCVAAIESVVGWATKASLA